MDAKSKIKAAKAVAEQAAYKKRKNDANDLFKDATSAEQVLAYLAGAASVCWSKQPQGTFDVEMINDLTSIALAKVDDLYRNQANQYIAEILDKAGITQEQLDASLSEMVGKRIHVSSDHEGSLPREYGKSALPSQQLRLDIQPDEERADSMAREGDHS